jgi:hypothetical protein
MASSEVSWERSPEARLRMLGKITDKIISSSNSMVATVAVAHNMVAHRVVTITTTTSAKVNTRSTT